MTKHQAVRQMAAAHMEQFARNLFAAHTLRGEWVILDDADRHAKEDHDELLMLARELRAVAEVANTETAR